MRGEGRGGRRLSLTVLCALVSVGVLAWPAVGQELRSAETGTAAEAWYQGSLIADDTPLCILPCPELAAPVNPYPDDTLHVGVTGGGEVARTYVTLDLSVLPTGAPLEGGEARFVVAGQEAGTAGAEVADMIACFVRGQVEPVEAGQPSDSPPADCTISSALEPVGDDIITAFTVNLAAFAAVYPGVGDLSLAVVPSDSAAEEAQAWRVAFHGRERDTEDAEPITATVRYLDPAAESPAPAGTVAPPPPDGFGGDRTDPFVSDRPPVATDASDQSTPPEPEVAPPTGDLAEAAPPPTPTAVRSATGYAYPQVWLLPLVFLCVGGLLIRALSQDFELELTLDQDASRTAGG